jgi:molybdopterin molybdotransferase
LDEALEQLLSSVKPLDRAESVSTFHGDGRVLAEDVISQLQVPPQDNSAMDGYALRCADVLHAGSELSISQRIPAGSMPEPLKAGTAARIFTGANVPAGADAVVMQEDCEAIADGGLRVNQMPNFGQHIRRAGQDVMQGATVLARGTKLSPTELGMAASVGRASLMVGVKPRVALFSTGDELVMPGTVNPDAMKAGSIYNSNRFFLRALLIRMGCEVSDLGIVPDNLEATKQALREAASSHDLILTSGGVSVGEEDHIKPAVQSLGELNLWQIAMKPGKPFAFGKIKEFNQLGSDPKSFAHSFSYFVGLPGNPAASFVTFLLLVRPLLLKLQGATCLSVPSFQMRADFDLPCSDKRREFLRVRRNKVGGLDLFPNQSSGVLTSAVWGDGLLDNPAGTTIKDGDLVNYYSFANLF